MLLMPDPSRAAGHTPGRPATIAAFAWAFLVMSVVPARAADLRERPSEEPARSPIRLVGYGVRSHILYLRDDSEPSGGWGNRPRIWLELSNRAGRPWWVALHLSAPIRDRVCEKRFPLERDERATTLCTQDSIVAGADYALDVTAFADSGYADLVDASSWTFQLARSEVAEWLSTRSLEREARSAPDHPLPTVPSRPVSHGALLLGAANMGISFGNAPVVHGLRLNWRDQELRRVDGLNVVVISDPSPEAVIQGIHVSLVPRDLNYIGHAAGQLWGLGLSPTALYIRRPRGVTAGVVWLDSEDSYGISFGGLLSAGPAVGIQTGLFIWGGPLTGINVAGIFGWSENGPMTGINVGGLLVRSPRVAGINIGGYGVLGDERVLGLSVSGFVVRGEHLSGIQVAPLVLSDDLVGLSLGAGHQLGRQRGVAIGLVNSADELHGIQVGLLNTARNNPASRRRLPILNWHFGP